MVTTWESYLDAAAECVRLAGRETDPVLKLKLSEMASLWLKMADQAYATPGYPEQTPVQ